MASGSGTMDSSWMSQHMEHRDGFLQPFGPGIKSIELLAQGLKNGHLITPQEYEIVMQHASVVEKILAYHLKLAVENVHDS